MNTLIITRLQSPVAPVLCLILILLCQGCNTESELVCPQNQGNVNASPFEAVEIGLEKVTLTEHYQGLADMQVIVSYASCDQIKTSAKTWTSEIGKIWPGDDMNLTSQISVGPTWSKPMLVHILVIDNRDLTPLADKAWDFAAHLFGMIAGNTVKDFKGIVLEQVISALADKAKNTIERPVILADELIRVSFDGETVLSSRQEYAKLFYEIKVVDPTPTFEPPLTPSLTFTPPTLIPTATMPAPLDFSYTFDRNCFTDGSNRWTVIIYIEVSGGAPPFTYYLHGGASNVEPLKRKFELPWTGNTGGDFVRTLEVSSSDKQNVAKEVYITNLCR